jgi:hypothetical protein
VHFKIYRFIYCMNFSCHRCFLHVPFRSTVLESVTFIIRILRERHNEADHTTPHHTTPDHTRPHQTTSDHTTPHHTTPHQTTPDQTTPDHIRPHHTTPDQTTPDHTTPDQTTPHHTRPHQTTPHHTTPDHTRPHQTTPDSHTDKTTHSVYLTQTDPVQTSLVPRFSQHGRAFDGTICKSYGDGGDTDNDVFPLIPYLTEGNSSM